MANNRDDRPVELPPLIISANPEPPPPLPQPLPAPRPTWQHWDARILHPDALGNLPFTTFTDRHINTMVVAMLDSTRHMQLAYEQARANLTQTIDQSLTEAGFTTDRSISSTREELQSDLALVRRLLSDTERLLYQHRTRAGQFFGGQNPHNFSGVDAFNHMTRTRQLYGRGAANGVYRAWVESYQAQYTAQLLDMQLADLRRRETQLDHAQRRALPTYAAPLKTVTGVAAVTAAGGVVKLAPNAVLPLAEAIALAVRAALAGLAAGTVQVLGVVLAGAGQVLGGVVGVLIPSPLGNSDRYPTSVPLRDLHTPDGNLHTLAAANGHVEMPVRLGTWASDQGVTLYAVGTGVGGVPSQVKVRAARYDAARDRFTFTTEGSNPVTLLWTPAVDPGNASTTRPIEEVASPDYRGPTVAPVDPYVEIFPGVAEGSFDDYVIVFPADSGLEPIYVMFKDRRDLRGLARGMGEKIYEGWKQRASEPQGAPIPEMIARRLRGKWYSSFDAFRRAFWIALSSVPEFANQFTKRQLSSMQKGLSPYVIESEQVGGRKVYELHHVKFLSQGGEVYDIDNIRVMTPRRHIDLHSESGGVNR